MLADTTEARVISVINELFPIEDQSSILEASIGKDFAETSLDRMTLFIALEDEFDRTLPQEEVEQIEKVKQVVQFIEELEIPPT